MQLLLRFKCAVALLMCSHAGPHIVEPCVAVELRLRFNQLHSGATVLALDLHALEVVDVAPPTWLLSWASQGLASRAGQQRRSGRKLLFALLSTSKQGQWAWSK